MLGSIALGGVVAMGGIYDHGRTKEASQYGMTDARESRMTEIPGVEQNGLHGLDVKEQGSSALCTPKVEQGFSWEMESIKGIEYSGVERGCGLRKMGAHQQLERFEIIEIPFDDP